VHVYVDKPLAAELDQAEQLVEQANKEGKALMVGFNRRFAPLYRQLKDNMQDVASLRMDKHRTNSVGPNDLRFTLLDDYLHVVDTALWLAGGNATLESGLLQINEADQMLYGEHHFLCGETLVTTSMHRRAGTSRESVQAVTEGAVYQLDNMQIWREEQQDILTQLPVPGWQSTLAQRGFVGAIEHFVDCVSNQTAPETSGEQAIYAQSMIENILNS